MAILVLSGSKRVLNPVVVQRSVSLSDYSQAASYFP